jgi:hypothetical protein
MNKVQKGICAPGKYILYKTLLNMKITFLLKQWITIGIIAAGFAINAGARPVHKTSAAAIHKMEGAAAHGQMTNQQYYDKLSGICDTLYIIRKALFGKILSVTPDKNWAALSAERQNLHSYCLRQLAYLAKLPDVVSSADVGLTLYNLLQTHRDMENVLKDFDGFTAGTGDADVQATFGKMSEKLKDTKREHQLFLIEKANYKKTYALQ